MDGRSFGESDGEAATTAQSIKAKATRGAKPLCGLDKAAVPKLV
jgi:hypothetical protein